MDLGGTGTRLEHHRQAHASDGNTQSSGDPHSLPNEDLTANGSKQTFTVLLNDKCNVPEPRATLSPLSDGSSSTQKNETMPAQENTSEHVKRILQELGVHLPSTFVEKMTLDYTGMMPLERFVTETCQLQNCLPEYPESATVSDSGATMGSSKEATDLHMSLGEEST